MAESVRQNSAEAKAALIQSEDKIDPQPLFVKSRTDE